MLIRVLDLIGRDLSGMRADVRSRKADGSLLYPHTAEDGPKIRQLEAVTRKSRGKDEVERGIGDADWVTLRWKSEGDCGFGGSCGSEHQQGWFIEVVSHE